MPLYLYRYPHEFSRLELRRLATFVVDGRCADLPMASKFLDHSQVCPRVEQMGDARNRQTTDHLVEEDLCGY